jgi:hypothetical protein
MFEFASLLLNIKLDISLFYLTLKLTFFKRLFDRLKAQLKIEKRETGNPKIQEKNFNRNLNSPFKLIINSKLLIVNNFNLNYDVSLMVCM